MYAVVRTQCEPRGANRVRTMQTGFPNIAATGAGADAVEDHWPMPLEYNVVAELDLPLDDIGDDHADEILFGIAPHHGALGRSRLGRAELVFTIRSVDLREAIVSAQVILTETLGELSVAGLRVLRTSDFDRVNDLDTIFG